MTLFEILEKYNYDNEALGEALKGYKLPYFDAQKKKWIAEFEVNHSKVTIEADKEIHARAALLKQINNPENLV